MKYKGTITVEPQTKWWLTEPPSSSTAWRWYHYLVGGEWEFDKPDGALSRGRDQIHQVPEFFQALDQRSYPLTRLEERHLTRIKFAFDPHPDVRNFWAANHWELVKRYGFSCPSVKMKKSRSSTKQDAAHQRMPMLMERDRQARMVVEDGGGNLL